MAYLFRQITSAEDDEVSTKDDEARTKDEGVKYLDIADAVTEFRRAGHEFALECDTRLLEKELEALELAFVSCSDLDGAPAYQYTSGPSGCTAWHLECRPTRMA